MSRILVVAPFHRGRQHGGSQRATALAERLEERGFKVDWRVLTPRTVSNSMRLRAGATFKPNAVVQYPRAAPQDADVAIAAHSYLAPALETFPARTRRVIDFHNLEWSHLADSADLASGGRRAYLKFQSALMARFERRVIRDASLCLFTCADERAWAGDGDHLLVPSVLPRQDEERAARLWRSPAVAAGAELVYVGTVSFPPNLGALRSFLRTTWPLARTVIPDLKLTIAGAADSATLESLNDHPGVEALGFVEDTAPLLKRSAAVIMPITGRAGTSLRALYFALAGAHVIGTEAAFRGLGWRMGEVAETPDDWVEAIKRAVTTDGHMPGVNESARRAAMSLQRDPGPWDRLAERLTTRVGAAV